MTSLITSKAHNHKIIKRKNS